AEKPGIREQFSRPFTLGDFLRVAGDDQVADGRMVRDVLKVLPSQSQFGGIDQLLHETGDREAAIVRTTVGAQAAGGAGLGIDGQLEQVREADVAKLGAVPTKARTALAKAGINTVGALAAANPGQVLEVMKEAGVPATSGDAAEWTGFAQTLSNLR